METNELAKTVETKAMAEITNTALTALENGDVDVACTDGGGSGSDNSNVCKIVFNLFDELQRDSSLEPGEVVTPPHISIKEERKESVLNVKRIIDKSELNSTENEKMKKQLQLFDNNQQSSTEKLPVNAGTKLAAVDANDEGDDDSEGLYSGSDTSNDDASVMNIEKSRSSLHSDVTTPAIATTTTVSAQHNFSISPFKNFMPHNSHFMSCDQKRDAMHSNYNRKPFHGQHAQAYGATSMRSHKLRRTQTPSPQRGHSPIRAPKTSEKSSMKNQPSLQKDQHSGSTTTTLERKSNILCTVNSRPNINWSLSTMVRHKYDELLTEYKKKGTSKEDQTSKLKQKVKSGKLINDSSRNNRNSSSSTLHMEKQRTHEKISAVKETTEKRDATKENEKQGISKHDRKKSENKDTKDNRRGSSKARHSSKSKHDVKKNDRKESTERHHGSSKEGRKHEVRKSLNEDIIGKNRESSKDKYASKSKHEIKKTTREKALEQRHEDGKEKHISRSKHEVRKNEKEKTSEKRRYSSREKPVSKSKSEIKNSVIEETIKKRQETSKEKLVSKSQYEKTKNVNEEEYNEKRTNSNENEINKKSNKKETMEMTDEKKSIANKHSKNVDATNAEMVKATATETKELYDIFAESPPRLTQSTTVTVEDETNEHDVAKIQIKANVKQQPILMDDIKTVNAVRSTTPPLSELNEKDRTKKKALEIKNRINKLLEDSDLELAVLQANKESLLRRTREHQKRTNILENRQHDQLKLVDECKLADSPNEDITMHIKQEPIDIGYEQYEMDWRNIQIKREPSPWEDVDEIRQYTPSPAGLKIPTILEEEKTVTKIRNQFKQKQQQPFHIVFNEKESDKRNAPKLSERYGTAFKYDNVTNIVSPANMKLPTFGLKSNYKISTQIIDNDDEFDDDNIDVDSNWILSSNSRISSKPVKSPDTDDYIDNWENDDSTIACDGTDIKHFMLRTNSNSNHLWNTNCTPPPRTVASVQLAGSTTPKTTPPKDKESERMSRKPIIDMQDMYDKFLNSIKMNSTYESGQTAEKQQEEHLKEQSNEISSNQEEDDEEESSTDDTDDEGEDEDEDDEEDGDDEAETETSSDETEAMTTTTQIKNNQDIQMKSRIDKDLKRLETLEKNLSRIQMMRENYDSGDELCEELIKMESLFWAEKTAIMQKYKKAEMSLMSTQPTDAVQNTSNSNELSKIEMTPNTIFDGKRETIKLTLSPLKLTRKSAIFERDEFEMTTTTTKENEQQKLNTKNLQKPKEIAIVKPIMDNQVRTRPRPVSPRKHSRRRSYSRHRESSSRSRSHTLSPRRNRAYSPRRQRERYRTVVNERTGRCRRSRSHSYIKRRTSYSRSRSRSPRRNRHRIKFARRHRSSYSPPPPLKRKFGPRSPPSYSQSRRHRSYSRERYTRSRTRSHSRSPLPFKPPSPPMRRSCSFSRSRSVSPHSRTRTRSRSRSYSPYAQYYGGSHSQDSASYYYCMPSKNQMLLDGQHNMLLNDCATGDFDANGSYDIYGNYGSYPEYDNPYMYMQPEIPMYPNMPNMPDGYVASNEIYYNEFGAPLGIEGMQNFLPSTLTMTTATPVLKELPKAPAVAVQKGNVLEIVPSGELPIEVSNELVIKQETPEKAAATEAAAAIAAAAETRRLNKEARRKQKIELRQAAKEAELKSGKKKVNFEDRVPVNCESDGEDRRIVENAIRRAIKKYKREKEKSNMNKLLNGDITLPPPPPGEPPADIPQPKYLLKKPIIRYYHFDPITDSVYPSYNRIPKPLPKCVPMFFNPDSTSGSRTIVSASARAVETAMTAAVTDVELPATAMQPSVKTARDLSATNIIIPTHATAILDKEPVPTQLFPTAIATAPALLPLPILSPALDNTGIVVAAGATATANVTTAATATISTITTTTATSISHSGMHINSIVSVRPTAKTPQYVGNIFEQVPQPIPVLGFSYNMPSNTKQEYDRPTSYNIKSIPMAEIMPVCENKLESITEGQSEENVPSSMLIAEFRSEATAAECLQTVKAKHLSDKVGSSTTNTLPIVQTT